jgi:thiamine biosynthesis protein ThiS
MSIAITLNGRPIATGEASTIMQLLNDFTIDPSHVVVEVNRLIIDKSHYRTCALHDDDEVEILRFVGGG